MSILRPVKAPELVGVVGETKFAENSVVVQWPPRAVLSTPKDVKTKSFSELMAFHRPVFSTGGHKGLTTKQRVDHRRQSWRKKFKR